ncbi:hypothetical protein BpHYR1_034938, partial [Brachionus plicatilis]
VQSSLKLVEKISILSFIFKLFVSSYTCAITDHRVLSALLLLYKNSFFYKQRVKTWRVERLDQVQSFSILIKYRIFMVMI